jgi:hypothetical protein
MLARTLVLVSLTACMSSPSGTPYTGNNGGYGYGGGGGGGGSGSSTGGMVDSGTGVDAGCGGDSCGGIGSTCTNANPNNGGCAPGLGCVAQTSMTGVSYVCEPADGG